MERADLVSELSLVSGLDTKVTAKHKFGGYLINETRTQ